MKKFIFLLLILPFFCLASPVFATTNNIFGIHITQIEDLKRTKELVNSQGGDWGYVTIVIQNNDQNFDKWQKFFDTLRENHLIPLVRLATRLDGSVWVKPEASETKNWAIFLDSLNWPIKNRYVIIYNEPNHDKEWGNDANPREYARILNQAIIDFKNKNNDFFILNAGLDQAAQNSKETINELNFLEQMNAEIPGIFNRIDGFASHSYPKDFIGQPWEKGRATIQGYLWELEILKNLGSGNDLPVFITETGWQNQLNIKYQTLNTNYIKEAFENVWLLDSRVMAVTPFILNYPYYPFAGFSWLDEKGNPYPQFEVIRSLNKIKGEPEQEEKYEIAETRLPLFLPTGFIFEGKIKLTNTGQSIWGEKPFILKANTPLELSDLSLPLGVKIKPQENWTFTYTLETPKIVGDYTYSWQGLPGKTLRVFQLFPAVSEPNSILNDLLKKVFDFFY